MVHKREPAILPSLLAADLAMLARDANRVAPEKTDYVRAPRSRFSLLMRAQRKRNEPAEIDRVRAQPPARSGIHLSIKSSLHLNILA